MINFGKGKVNMANKDLALIKKYYGEKFMHLCRSLFPTILEQEGLLFKTIYNKIAPTKLIYDDVIKDVQTFQEYINISTGVKPSVLECLDTGKTPEQLLMEKGYVLYPECQTEKDIQQFRKYYKLNETLCTFYGNRLDLCRVWFAVKQNVDEIIRENFPYPSRQDEYGTSVISIQFTRGNVAELSIKNRYNHAVKNPDATFSNNLENIIPGLTQAFQKTYNINLAPLSLRNCLDLKKYIVDNFGRYHRTLSYCLDYQFAPYYFCENNTVVFNGKVTEYDKNKYILMNNYLVDLSKKTIVDIMNQDSLDSFLSSLGEIEDIKLEKNLEGCKVLVLKVKEGEDVKLTLDKLDQLIEYYNPNVQEIDNNFLNYCKSLQKFDAPNLTKIKDCFLLTNEVLSVFNAPKLEKVGEYCLKNNKGIINLDLPSLEYMDEKFMADNIKAQYINLPKLKVMYEFCFACNRNAKQLNIPKLETMEDYCFNENQKLQELDAPSLKNIGYECFIINNSIKNCNLPNLTTLNDYAFFSNKVMDNFYAPKLKKFGKHVLADNEKIKLRPRKFLFW